MNMKGEVIGINSAKLSDTKVGRHRLCHTDICGRGDHHRPDEQTDQREVVTDSSKQAYLGIVGVGIDSSTASVMNMPEGVVINNLVEALRSMMRMCCPGMRLLNLTGRRSEVRMILKSCFSITRAAARWSSPWRRLENGDYVEHTVTVTLGYASSAPADNSNR